MNQPNDALQKKRIGGVLYSSIDQNLQYTLNQSGTMQAIINDPKEIYAIGDVIDQHYD